METKFNAHFERSLHADNGVVEVTFATSDRTVANALKTLADTDLDVSVKKHTGHRSLNANSYFWLLADKLAKRLSEKDQRPITSKEIYRQYIRDVGAFEYLPIRADVAEHFSETWTSFGEGFIAEDMGDCSRLQGYKTFRCYYGSSKYNKEQMGRLIDLIVDDCKQQGIETATPNELENLKSMWGQAQ